MTFDIWHRHKTNKKPKNKRTNQFNFRVRSCKVVIFLYYVFHRFLPFSRQPSGPLLQPPCVICSGVIGISVLCNAYALRSCIDRMQSLKLVTPLYTGFSVNHSIRSRKCKHLRLAKLTLLNKSLILGQKLVQWHVPFVILLSLTRNGFPHLMEAGVLLEIPTCSGTCESVAFHLLCELLSSLVL